MADSPLASPMLWDEIHEYYDETLVPPFSLASKRGFNLVAPTSTAKILDVACGPGTLTLLAAPRVAHVTAVDFSPKMLELLDQKRKTLGLDNISTQIADGMALPFENDHFDAAFSCFGVFLFSDRHRGLTELYRVVKPNAKVMISSWAPPDGIIEVMYDIVREVLPQLPFKKGSAPLGTEDDLRTELTNAGFTSIEVEPTMVPFDFQDIETFWDANSRASAPLVATRRAVGPKEWRIVEDRILSALRTHLHGRVTYERIAWVAMGSKPIRA